MQMLIRAYAFENAFTTTDFIKYIRFCWKCKIFIFYFIELKTQAPFLPMIHICHFIHVFSALFDVHIMWMVNALCSDKHILLQYSCFIVVIQHSTFKMCKIFYFLFDTLFFCALFKLNCLQFTGYHQLMTKTLCSK